MNAMQAMPAGGTVRVRAENSIVSSGDNLPLEPGEYIMISIEDKGPGIPSDILEKVFDPYYTTKDRGAGLGLALAYSIINKHDGHISIESEVGLGTTVTLYLPVSPEESRLTQCSINDRVSKKILVMDDDSSVMNVVTKMLKRLGFEAAGVF